MKRASDIERHVWVGRNAKHQRRARVPRAILEGWVEECHRYCELMNDVCWWYNERASVSTFAIAAGKTPGWVALEEYSTSKEALGDEARAAAKYGRCDLYVANKEQEFAFEFKQAWQTLFPTAPGTYLSLEKGWTDALADSRKLKSDEGDRHFAGLFVVPFAPVGRSADAVKDAWNRLRTAVMALDDIAAMAFYSRSAPGIENSKGNRTFPGVFLALRER